MFRCMSISDMERMQEEINKLRSIAKPIELTAFDVIATINTCCRNIEEIIGEIYERK